MIRVEQSITIARPAEEVFAYASDPAKAPEWQGSLLEVNTDGPLQQGTTLTETRKFLGKRIESKVMIEQFEPPQKLFGRVIEGPVPFRIEQTFAPEGAGSRVSVMAEGEPAGFWKLGEALVERNLRRELANNLETLKDILEAGQ
jgi:carbon monoxide dehydrogenase subunit G